MKKVENMPLWVYWGLWTINTRKIAMAYLIFAVLSTLALVPYAFMIGKYHYAFVVIVPLWYWGAIKWADNNNVWVNNS